MTRPDCDAVAEIEKQISRKEEAETAGEKLSNVFGFCEEVFEDGQEILILVTELTVSYYGARFISRYGCKEYFNHNKARFTFVNRALLFSKFIENQAERAENQLYYDIKTCFFTLYIIQFIKYK